MVLSSWPVLFQPGIYDGDMIIGRDYLQPDQAGSFGFELTNLCKRSGISRNGKTSRNIVLESVLKISNTLAGHTTNVFLVLSFIGSVIQEIPFNDWTTMESVLQHVTQNPT